MRCQQIVSLDSAIKNKNYEAIYDILANSDMDINQEGRCGWTPLLVAVDNGDEKIVETFLKMGANPNCCVVADEFPSAIEWALNYKIKETNQIEKYTKIIDLLLSYGAREIQNHDTGETCLHLAAKLGNLDLIKLFIKFGFNPNLQDKAGLTPIDIARLNGHLVAADYLASCSSNDVDIEKILEAGVIDQKEYEAYDLVFNCQLSKQKDIPTDVTKKIKFFTLYNRGIMERGGDRGVVAAVENNDYKGLKKALSEGYVINDGVIHNFQNTPLEVAVKKDNKKIASLLIQYGSILTDSAYKKAKNPEMKKILLDEKRKQMQILKDELGLEDKDPSTCLLDSQEFRWYGLPG